MASILLKEKIPKFAFFARSLKENEVPIFVSHYVIKDEFRSNLEYLKNNGYYTLSTDEFYGFIKFNNEIPKRSVLLTFDDGHLNNWDVVFPLLKEFNMKATIFVTPGTMTDKLEGHLDLDNTWPSFSCFSWQEAKIMQDTGLVDIQSHTLAHQVCFINSKIVDFQRPLHNGEPKYRWLWTAVEAGNNDELWGAPVYEYRSRMTALRYFDGIHLRKSCMDFVSSNGGVRFFDNLEWRWILNRFVNEFRIQNRVQDNYETKEEQVHQIKYSLAKSREVIKEKLNKDCFYLALPWNQGNSLTLKLIEESGYRANFSGTSSFVTAKYGSNPYLLNRVEGYWIKSLPGKGRVSVFNKLGSRLCKSAN
ncbi:MAG: polysaccharide deacetylase family protein [Candidatus Omnitrophica bacterium]|nr:polysaccharide deacetylase family protein [Candidatus Omnitrophota bacterium]MBU1869143.1 polysaccharide deacetylase family protein [Candidatus Omnitrophota bacterium]